LHSPTLTLFSPNVSSCQRVSVDADEYFLMTATALLEEIFSDQGVTDILIDGCQTTLIEKQGKLERINQLFQDENELNL
jgi:Flp pilus assembly CpaF family ATPase